MAQCPSVYPTKSGFVFCTHEHGHPGSHKGFRKTWKTCECILRKENSKYCPHCSGMGVVEMKKAGGGVRLTEAQVELLRRAAKKSGAYAGARYLPMKKLLKLGFIDDGDGGTTARSMFSGNHWFATEAGRSWLTENGFTT